VPGTVEEVTGEFEQKGGLAGTGFAENDERLSEAIIHIEDRCIRGKLARVVVSLLERHSGRAHHC